MESKKLINCSFYLNKIFCGELCAHYLKHFQTLQHMAWYFSYRCVAVHANN